MLKFPVCLFFFLGGGAVISNYVYFSYANLGSFFNFLCLMCFSCFNLIAIVFCVVFSECATNRSFFY